MKRKILVVYCSIVPHNVPPYWLFNTAQKLSEKFPVLFIDLPEKPPRIGFWGSLRYVKWMIQKLSTRPSFLLWNPAFRFSHHILFLYLLFIKVVKGFHIVLVTTFPEELLIYPYIPYDKICYDCTDQYYTKQFSDNKKSIQSLDMVFTNSKLLYTLIKNITPKVLKISSGYIERVDIAKHIPNPLPNSIIFSGGISHRIDYYLLYEVASLLPNHHFYFIGEVYLKKYYEDVGDEQYFELWQLLNTLPNVHYLGVFSPEQSRRILPLFATGIIPYDVTDEMSYYSHPIKFYEYLAAGLHIVSTPLPSVLEYVDKVPIFVAENPQKMAQTILNIKLNTSVRIKKKGLLRLLKEQSLERKCEQMVEWLSNLT